MGKVLRFLLLLLNVVAAAWLGLCYMASVTKPGTYPYLALFNLTTPIVIVVNFIFLLIWLLGTGKWRAVVSGIALVACYKVVIVVFAFNFFTISDFSPAPKPYESDDMECAWAGYI